MSEGDEGFLARWSRRKIEAKNAPPGEAPKSAEAKPIETAPVPRQSGLAAEGDRAPALPPIDSLTPHSDFAPFMSPGVDPAVKGNALKTLFSDPALYPMDGLDVYIDDYSKPDPLPEGWLEKLNQLATLHGEPPPPRTEAVAGVDAADAQPAPSPALEEPAQQPGAPQDSTTSAPLSAQPDPKNRDAT